MKKILTVVCLSVTVLSATGSAQTAQAQAAPARQLTCKVDVVLTRLEGEKVLGASPFSLIVNGVNNIAKLRIGIEVPSGTTPTTEGARAETTFKTVGTQIDAYLSSTALNEERLPLQISINDTAVFSDDNADRIARAELDRETAAKTLARQQDMLKKNLTSAQSVDAAETKLRAADLDLQAARKNSAVLPSRASMAAFRSFSYSNTLYLRDGQTQEIIVASDRTSGETVKASVKLTIVK